MTFYATFKRDWSGSVFDITFEADSRIQAWDYATTQEGDGFKLAGRPYTDGDLRRASKNRGTR